MKAEHWHPLYFLNRQFKLDIKHFLDEVRANPINEQNGLFIKKLEWDSDTFNSNIFKILFIDSNTYTSNNLALTSENQSIPTQYFVEIPSEAVSLSPLLTESGFSLIETRMTYFHTLEYLPKIEQKARLAAKSDIPSLKKVASGAINSFDRYHADPFFSKQATDHYLETYVENCINGFAEQVFVPDLKTEPYSFVAISRLNDISYQEDRPIFRIPLTASLGENKGWHYHLCLAALHYAKQNNSECLVMTTQSTNKAVIHNCEKLGFKFGSCFHIFSKSFN